MKVSLRVPDGLVAGLLAGLVLAVLFFFYDLGQGTLGRTPAFLWGAITRRANMDSMITVVMGVTIAHFLAWGGLGVVARLLVRCLSLPGDIVIGTTYGLFMCSSVFYLRVIGIPEELVMSTPGWPAVFFANGLAGAVMFMHMQRVKSGLGLRGLLSFLRPSDTTRQGVYTGLIGGAVVVAWFLVLDLLLRQPLYAPAAMGTMLFGSGARLGNVDVALRPALGYGLWHFSFFILLGVVLCIHVDHKARFRTHLFQVLGLLFLFGAFVISITAVLGRPVLQELGWWSILMGNGLSAIAMSGYLFKVRQKNAEELPLGIP